MYEGVIFGIPFDINPVAFTIPIGGGWDVYWYGIIIALAFLSVVVYAMKKAKQYELDIDKMIDVALVTTPVAILCARLYYIIFDGEKLNGISDFFGFDGGGFSGLAIYGGVIGAFGCGFLMCKIKKLNFLDMFDIAAVCFLLAQGIGRWGNFFNQEVYGVHTGSNWWGMMSNRTVNEMGAGLVHPLFLYEFVWCVVGFFVITHFAKNRKFKGQNTLLYGVWYGFGRAFLELLRPSIFTLTIGKLPVSSLLSFVLCIVCSILLVLALKKHDKVEEYIPLFTENEEEIITEEEVVVDGQDN